VRSVVAGAPYRFFRSRPCDFAGWKPGASSPRRPSNSRYRRVVTKRFEQPGGELVEYEIKDEDDIALTTEREVVLLRQFRHHLGLL
jgi:hypothetical protein